MIELNVWILFTAALSGILFTAELGWLVIFIYVMVRLVGG